MLVTLHDQLIRKTRNLIFHTTQNLLVTRSIFRVISTFYLYKFLFLFTNILSVKNQSSLSRCSLVLFNVVKLFSLGAAGD